MMRNLLAAFPVVIDIPVAWGEMDAFGHVNNIIYFRYFESARIAYFDHVGYEALMEEEGLGPILAATSCRYRVPLTFPDTVSVGARVASVDTDRFRMEYRVVSHKHQKLAAEGDGDVVSYNYREGAKAPLPDAVRLRIEAIESGVGEAE
ncbi:MAG: acyl-CoA thioesterase [Desulfococcaceae bacterium]